MAFRVHIIFSVTKEVRQYQWSVAPTDQQIREVIKNFQVFRYEKEFIKALIRLRDTGLTKYVPWDKSFEMTVST